MKTFIKVSLVLLFITYMVLYLSYRNGYYIDKNKEKTILTEELIKEYEEDLKKGVDVSKKDYVILENSYDNDYTRTSLKISNGIEKAFDKLIKYLFGQVSKTINE